MYVRLGVERGLKNDVYWKETMIHKHDYVTDKAQLRNGRVFDARKTDDSVIRGRPYWNYRRISLVSVESTLIVTAMKPRRLLNLQLLGERVSVDIRANTELKMANFSFS